MAQPKNVIHGEQKKSKKQFQTHSMTVKNLYAIYSVIVSFLLGIIFIYLFCWKAVGVSHLIFYFIYVIAALVPVFILEPQKNFEKFTPLFFLLPLALLFSTVFLYRLDSGWLTLAFLTIPVLYWVILSGVFHIETYKNFSFLSFILLPFLLPIAWLGDVMKFVKEVKIPLVKKKYWSWAMRIMKGGIIAIPFLLLFATLLSSADQVFADLLKDFFKDTFGTWFEDFGMTVQTIGKSIVGLMVAFHTMVYYFSLWNRDSFLVKLLKKNSDQAIKEMKRSWDVIASSIFLFLLNFLFVTFVVIQIKYIFGGDANVLTHGNGFTYSNYARRGFNELVIVALISYALISILNIKVYTKGMIQKVIFRGNFILLLLSSLVITYSAFARIRLYSDVYGYTQLRLLVPLGIIVIGILFLLLIISSFLPKPRKFINISTTVLLIIASTVWMFTPVDYVVAKLNELRYVNEGKIDLVYMARQSNEAIPVMLQMAQDPDYEVSDNISILLMAELEQRWKDSKDQKLNWQSYNFMRQYNRTEMKHLFADSKIDWSTEAENSLNTFLNAYRNELLSGNYQKAYDEYWTKHSEELDLKPLEKVDITKYEYTYIPAYRSWKEVLGSSYWRGLIINCDLKYEYKSEHTAGSWFKESLFKESRYESIYVILENGEWKIKDAHFLTLGNFQDGNKGVYFRNTYFEQNENLEHLFTD